MSVVNLPGQKSIDAGPFCKDSRTNSPSPFANGRSTHVQKGPLTSKVP